MTGYVIVQTEECTRKDGTKATHRWWYQGSLGVAGIGFNTWGNRESAKVYPTRAAAVKVGRASGVLFQDDVEIEKAGAAS